MCRNKIFMKGRQRFVLYWKQTYSIGLARNPFHYLWRKIRKLLLIMSLLSRFHALRVAPKTIGHEVKAVCVKLMKHLTILKKHKRLFCRSRKHGITLHILCVYACLRVVNKDVLCQAQIFNSAAYKRRLLTLYLIKVLENG